MLNEIFFIFIVNKFLRQRQRFNQANKKTTLFKGLGAQILLFDCIQ